MTGIHACTYNIIVVGTVVGLGDISHVLAVELFSGFTVGNDVSIFLNISVKACNDFEEVTDAVAVRGDGIALVPIHHF